MATSNRFPILMGGLMRCCIQSIYDHEDRAAESFNKDLVVHCKYCGAAIEFKYTQNISPNGFWRWSGKFDLQVGNPLF